MTKLLQFIVLLIGSAGAAFAADPVEIRRCKSSDTVLSIYKNKKNYEASLVSPMTREKIERTFPGSNLSEDMLKLLLAQKPTNQIPIEYREYDSFEASDETVKNGFKLRGRNIGLDLVKNDENRIDVRFSFWNVNGSMTESRSGTLPLGVSSTVECEEVNVEN